MRLAEICLLDSEEKSMYQSIADFYVNENKTYFIFLLIAHSNKEEKCVYGLGQGNMKEAALKFALEDMRKRIIEELEAKGRK